MAHIQNPEDFDYIMRLTWQYSGFGSKVRKGSGADVFNLLAIAGPDTSRRRFNDGHGWEEGTGTTGIDGPGSPLSKMGNRMFFRCWLSALSDFLRSKPISGNSD